MTTKKLIKTIKTIQAKDRGDFEAAHALEDDVLWDFVEEVAKGGLPMRKQARLLLEHKKMPRVRLCA